MVVIFELDGTRYTLLNGGSENKQSEAVSMYVSCDSQAEVDHLWDSLIADGGAEIQCGWLKDRFGLAWQIVPKELDELLDDSQDADKRKRVFAAMMTMVKIDVAALRAAAQGE